MVKTEIAMLVYWFEWQIYARHRKIHSLKSNNCVRNCVAGCSLYGYISGLAWHGVSQPASQRVTLEIVLRIAGACVMRNIENHRRSHFAFSTYLFPSLSLFLLLSCACL